MKWFYTFMIFTILYLLWPFDFFICSMSHKYFGQELWIGGCQNHGKSFEKLRKFLGSWKLPIGPVTPNVIKINLKACWVSKLAIRVGKIVNMKLLKFFHLKNIRNWKKILKLIFSSSPRNFLKRSLHNLAHSWILCSTYSAVNIDFEFEWFHRNTTE